MLDLIRVGGRVLLGQIIGILPQDPGLIDLSSCRIGKPNFLVSHRRLPGLFRSFYDPY